MNEIPLPWQWNNQQHAWWKEATIMADGSDRPWNDPRATQFWKNLRVISPAFDCSVRYQIAQGSTTKFWHDTWMDQPLNYSYPDLYCAAQQKNSSIQQNRVLAEWDIQFMPLNPETQIQKNHLLSSLQNFHTTQGHDTIVWLRHSNNFSVSSAYSFLAQTPSPTTTLPNIWSIKAPLRVTIFAWLMLTNRLTTVDNLVKRGWNLPNMCAMCKKNEETAQHLFQTCETAAQIRSYIYTAFATRYSISAKFCTITSSQILTDPNERQTARRWELTTCFILWRERCRRIFSDRTEAHIMLVREIVNEYNSWFTATLNSPFTG